jgi:hypothetical protein
MSSTQTLKRIAILALTLAPITATAGGGVASAIPSANNAPQFDLLAKKGDKGDSDLPGGKWDTRVLEQSFRVVKTKFDAAENKVTWLLEKTTDDFVAIGVSFYDEDDVKLTYGYVELEPASVAKGERTRGSVTLPKDDILKKCVRVVLTKR